MWWNKDSFFGFIAILHTRTSTEPPHLTNFMLKLLFFALRCVYIQSLWYSASVWKKSQEVCKTATKEKALGKHDSAAVVLPRTNWNKQQFNGIFPLQRSLSSLQAQFDGGNNQRKAEKSGVQPYVCSLSWVGFIDCKMNTLGSKSAVKRRVFCSDHSSSFLCI